MRMAKKVLSKSTEKPAEKAVKAKKPAKAKVSKKVANPHAIDEACNLALELLRELDMEEALQADLQWCLGSYQADGNPVGLYQMLERAVLVFEREKEVGNKKITAEVTQALSKALKG
jgi:hypothetical protein